MPAPAALASGPHRRLFARQVGSVVIHGGFSPRWRRLFPLAREGNESRQRGAWAAKRSNPEVSARSACSTDLTNPRATIGAWLDNQHCSLLTRIRWRATHPLGQSVIGPVSLVQRASGFVEGQRSTHESSVSRSRLLRQTKSSVAKEADHLRRRALDWRQARKERTAGAHRAIPQSETLMIGLQIRPAVWPAFTFESNGSGGRRAVDRRSRGRHDLRVLGQVKPFSVTGLDDGGLMQGFFADRREPEFAAKLG